MVFGIITAGTAALFVYWPTCLSGGGYDIEVTVVTIDPSGKVRFEWKDRLAYGLRTDWKFPGPNEEHGITLDNVDCWGYREGPFRWPRRRTNDHAEFDLNPKGRHFEGGVDPEEMRRRVILQPGTYRLDKDGRLVIFRAKTTSGEVMEGFIEVTEDYSK